MLVRPRRANIVMICTICFVSVSLINAILPQSRNSYAVLSKGLNCCLHNCCRRIMNKSSSVSCEKCHCTCIPYVELKKFNPKKLTDLRLNYNLLKNLTPRCFEKFPNLINLSITDNRIRFMDPNAFAGLDQLRLLNLTWNKMSSFPDNVFAPLRQLTVIGLDHTTSGKCDNFNSMSFGSYNSTLKAVSLKYNRLFDSPKFLRNSSKLSLLPFVESFDMEHNYLRSLKAEKFLGLENVENLYFGNNQIKFIENDCFMDLKKLKVLIMDKNNLGQVSSHAFWSVSLQFLSLADSDRFVLNETIQVNFEKIPDLRILNIRNANIKHESVKRASLFANCKKMVELNMQGTKMLSFQAKEYLQHFTNLKKLNLIANNIETVDRETYEPFATTLKELHLGNNRISMINITSLPALLWTQLDFIDLSGNPWSCDCRIVWFKSWLQHNINRTFTADNRNQYRCNFNTDGVSVPLLDFTKLNQVICATVQTDACFISSLICVLAFNATSIFMSILHRFRWHIRYWYFKYKVRSPTNHLSNFHITIPINIFS